MTDNKHTLDHLFALAKQQEPLINNAQTHELIQHAPTKAFPGKQLVMFIQNHLKLTIMSTIVSVIIGSVLWMHSTKPQTSLQKESNVVAKKASSVVITDTVSSHAGGKAMHIRYTSRQDSLKKFTVRRDSTPNIPASTSANIVTSTPAVINYTPVDGTDNILELTLSEFCNLGFVRTDNSFLYANFSPDSMWVGEKYRLNWYGYFPIAFFPIREKTNMKTISNNTFYPVFQTPRYLPKPIHYLPHDYKNLSDVTSGKNIRDFNVINDTLVPVTIAHITDTTRSGARFIDKIISNCISEKLYWFNPTQSFYSHLPERYRERIMRFYENTKAIKRSTTYKVDLVKYDNSLKINNRTDPLELSNEDLKKLGFGFRNGAILYNNITFLYANKKIFSVNGSNVKDTVNLGDSNHLDFYPPYISTDDGELISTTSNYEKRSISKGFIKNTNRLVPILIDMKTYWDYSFNKLIFWFTPTEAFFDSLPKPIGNEIRTEYHALLMKDNPAIAPAQKAQVVTSCKYFEECRVTYDGLTEMAVAPNPTSDALTVKVTFAKPTSCFIQLFDLRGRFIKTLKAPELVDIGTYQFAVSLGGLPAGIYILIIRDNKGNSKTQRVVKI